MTQILPCLDFGWWRRDAGTAALEFGLVSPLLVLFVVGAVEIGTSAYQGMQAQNAAEAGAVYASKHGADAAGISNAVVNATVAAEIAAMPTPSQFCACPVAEGLDVIDCASTCPEGDAPGYYIRIRAQIVHEPLISVPGQTSPATLNGESVVRMY